MRGLASQNGSDCEHIEACVLGSLLRDPGALEVVRPHVGGAVWRKPAHAHIYDQIVALIESGEGLDVALLEDRLRSAGKLKQSGGPVYLLELAETVPTALNAEHYAKRVREHADARRRQYLARKLHRATASGDLEAVRLLSEKIQHSAEESLTGRSRRLVMQRLSEVEAVELEWLWPGRIPLGKVSLIGGDPGLGKSFMTLDMASRVSTGSPWPDSEDQSRREPGDVLLLSAEDDLADTIRPRLDAHLADPSRIVALQAVRTEDGERQVTLQDIGPLMEAVTPQTRLIIVDPITAYAGKIDSHKNAEVRGLLAPLANFAAKHKVAVVAVTHLRKGRGKASYRMIGSLAWVAAARTAWAVSKDKEDPARRLWTPVKFNIGPEPVGLAYRIIDGRLQWRGPVEETAEELIGEQTKQQGRPSSAREDAIDLIRRALANGPMPSADVKQLAKLEGVSRNTLWRAKDEVGVEAEKRGSAWWWRLPKNVWVGGADED